MRSEIRLLPLLCLSVAGPGCASAAMRSLSDTVDESIVEYFPQEGRRWSYEAENEVIIALDRLDSARDEVADVERMIEEAQAALDRASERGGKGQEPTAAKIQWLEVRRDYAYSEVTVAEWTVLCARASLELTKAQLAIRFDLPVEEDFLEPFEAQYQDCAKDLEQAKQEADGRSRQAMESKDNWRTVRSSYAKRSGDYNYGLWIE